MTAEFKTIVRTNAGAKIAEITDHLGLAYGKRLMTVGRAHIALPGSSPTIALLADKCQLEIHRRNVARGIDWYCDFYGLVCGSDYGFSDRLTYVLFAEEEKSILGWQHILYDANVSGRTKFVAGKAETIAKEMVKYNATSSGTTADGRDRNATSGGAVNGLTVAIQADGAGGNTVDWYCARDNLLTSLQKLAKISGGDFDLVRTGAATYEFRWYATRRGSDLTASVVFSLARNNMRNPRLIYDPAGEKTVAIVGGGGSETSRTVVTRTGANYHVGTNAVEMFVDARDLGTDTASLEDRGDQKLDEVQARRRFSFEVKQTDADAYGKNYCIGGQLGDLVRASFGGLNFDQKIIGVDVASERDGSESIALAVIDE